MKQIKLSLFLLAFVTLCKGQVPIKSEKNFEYKNSLQVELFGHGLLYSFNYERLIFNGQRFKTMGQVGLAYYPPSTGIIDIWLPIVINELISFDRHHIELGLGGVLTNYQISTFDNKYRRESDIFFTGRLGYRFQKPNGRLVLRIGFTPFLEYNNYSEFHPSGGISAGYNF